MPQLRGGDEQPKQQGIVLSLLQRKIYPRRAACCAAAGQTAVQHAAAFSARLQSHFREGQTTRAAKAEAQRLPHSNSACRLLADRACLPFRLACQTGGLG